MTISEGNGFQATKATPRGRFFYVWHFSVNHVNVVKEKALGLIRTTLTGKHNGIYSKAVPDLQR